MSDGLRIRRGRAAHSTPDKTSSLSRLHYTTSSRTRVGRRWFGMRGLLAMSIVAGTTVTTVATMHVASAGACTSFASGTYLGTWQVNSGPAVGAAGAGEEAVTFSGSSLSGSVSFVTGTTAVAAGDTLSGTVGCNSFSGTLDNFTFNETSSTATNLSGTFSDTFGDIGT
jgi:hypothetical protein